VDLIDDRRWLEHRLTSLRQDLAAGHHGTGARTTASAFSSLRPDKWLNALIGVSSNRVDSRAPGRPIPSSTDRMSPGPAVSHGSERPLGQPARRLFPQLLAYCAPCHQTPLDHPPGFLYGSPAQIESRIDACAARMLAHTSSWAKPEQARRVAPMPPPSHLEALGSSPQQWTQDQRMHELIASLRALLDAAEIRGIRSRAAPAGSERPLQPGC
jgi:hypothetical protein